MEFRRIEEEVDVKSFLDESRETVKTNRHAVVSDDLLNKSNYLCVSVVTP